MIAKAKLVLVRQGRPDEDDRACPNDPPLNADERCQAHAVARLLACESVARIVASPLVPARQTAEPLAERLGLPIDTIEGWAEADRNTARRGWRRFLEDPVRHLGADPQEFRAGVLAALEDATRAGPSPSLVAVFTHGLQINVVLWMLEGDPYTRTR